MTLAFLSLGEVRPIRLTSREVDRSSVYSIKVFVVPGRILQQTFREKPSDTIAVEGDTVELPCSVDNQAGAVQWSKDGFVLGFDRAIPGYDRYSMTGYESDGEHHLRIDGVRIEDDGEYQCQVGPAPGIRAIRANAHLTVLLRPKTIDIEGRLNGTAIRIKQTEKLKLTCKVTGGKPAAQIRWLRRNVEFRPDSAEFRIEEADEHRKNTISTLTLTPGPEDNGTTYYCEALHPALISPFKAGVELSVIYPPSPPEITGYQEGETIRRGDTLTLTCVSRGGNPLAKVIWYRNDEQVDISYVHSGKESINSHTFVVDAHDNNAVYRCQASNSVSPRPMVAMVKLAVQFAPTKVTISGPKEARAGEAVTMVCTSDRSNPPAEISWVIDGRPVITENNITADPEGGWITISNITVNISSQERNMKMFSCYAINEALGETTVESTVLNIFYPPDVPTILGYTEGTPIKAGNTQSLTCVVLGGNPVATVKWFRMDEEVKSSTTTNGDTVTSEILLAVEESDNGAEYRCEASNLATISPLATAVKLTVLFPPSGVSIIMEPRRPKSGQQVTLTCESSSSNPAATLTWWKKELLVQGIHGGIFDDLHGGKSSRSLLKFNVTPDDDCLTYTCQATNQVLQQSVHDSVTLSVVYAPRFLTASMETFEIEEGESIQINLTAKANPFLIVYTWTKEGQSVPTAPISEHEPFPRVYSEGPLLTVVDAHRDDGGTYKCEAHNDEGYAEILIVLNVLYAATIVKVSDVVIVDPGGNAYLECEGDANPVTEDLIRWRRTGFDMNRTRQAKERGRSTLLIFNVTNEDVGEFQCVASNGIGQEATAVAQLLIKRRPEVFDSHLFRKSAFGIGNTAKLVCKVKGVSNITFTWKRHGNVIGIEGRSERYSASSFQKDLFTWESILYIEDVNMWDYGPYECIARNDMGQDAITITLSGISRPDPPFSVNIVNVTHDSVSLSWTPGFDGGLTQYYRIRYKPAAGQSIYSYKDVLTPNASSFTISGLPKDSEYLFSILAYNDLGESPYTMDFVNATTLSESQESENQSAITQLYNGRVENPRFIIICVSVVGGTLFILNIVIVVCFLWRRKKKGTRDECDQTSMKSTTLEMGPPGKYNETTSGETLSFISEKSEPCSQAIPGEYKDGTEKTATTYLIDRGDDSYIPNGIIPRYPAYSEQTQTEKIQYPYLDHSPKLPSRRFFEAEVENYSSSYGENTFQIEKNSPRPSSGYPPPPPGRTAASTAIDPYFPPSDVGYISYEPVGTSGLPYKQPPPHLRTFIPQKMESAYPPPPDITVTAVPPSPQVNGSVCLEMTGHAV